MTIFSLKSDFWENFLNNKQNNNSINKNFISFQLSNSNQIIYILSQIQKMMNTKELLTDIGQLYNICINDLKLLSAHDHNFVYEFQLQGNNYILRFGTRHSSELVTAELDWILYLHKAGVKVSIPVLSKNKNHLEVITKGDKVYNVVVFEKAPGKKVDITNPDQWNENFWFKMGCVMGSIHAASIKYNVEHLKFSRELYEDEETEQWEKYLDPGKDPVIFQKFKKLKANLEQFPKEKGSYGLIHEDFHLENMHVHDGEIFVFDWDDSHYFFYMYDLAACFHETIWDNPVKKRQEFANRFIPAFWKGYSTQFHLDRKWLLFLKDFFKWREFIIYICLLRDLDDDKVSERIKERLPFWIREFRDYILDNTQICEIPQDLGIWFPE
ncbi:MAG: phosphotransferase [Candidatus Methanofastidiosia archaeon]|jgi:Ser/Thr protein kinase RdoA (MazF antagonist)